MNARVRALPRATVSTVVIGAGQAGLAVSHHLSAKDIDHVLIERGEVANSWQTERWDSLRLLTPRWQSVLPGMHRAWDDADGFMDMPELVRFLKSYAGHIDAPIHSHTSVTGVFPKEQGYRVVTTAGEWHCRSVVMASGAFNKALVPTVAAGLPTHIQQLTSMQYRNPSQLRPGGVLVVGASATGLQLAQEIQQAGHEITLAIGEHVRLPRQYRQRDIFWWMERCGLLNKSYREVDDLTRARRLPSPQLVGSDDHSDLNLNTLKNNGAQLVGRLAGINNGEGQFSGSLNNVCKLADLKMNRLLDTIDDWACASGIEADVPEPQRFAATDVAHPAALTIDFRRGNINNVIWATGYRPDYSWLHVPVLDRKGQLRHEGGVVHAPGLYAMGLPYMRRHKSSFIHGAADDARDITTHLAAYLSHRDQPWLSASS